MVYNITGTNVIKDDNTTTFKDIVVTTLRTPGFYLFQGQTKGYFSGGSRHPSDTPSGFTNEIQTFPFSTDTNATDAGDLTVGKTNLVGHSSNSNGYISGGYSTINVIEKFPFSSSSNATDVGDLTVGRNQGAGSSSSTHGYHTGGSTQAVPTLPSNIIDKFTFAVDANATDVGDLAVSVAGVGGGNSSSDNGYCVGGNPAITAIQKYPFATDTNASNVADISAASGYAAGQSSDTHGYRTGGNTSIGINKFQFATDGDGAKIGDLVLTRDYGVGQSSTANGYYTGGQVFTNPSPPPVSPVNNMEKFPFASDANAADVGDLTGRRSSGAGQQV